MTRVAAVVTILFAFLRPPDGVDRSALVLLTLLVAATVAGAGQLTGRLGKSGTHRVLWVLVPVLAVIGTTALDLFTADTSTTAVVFFFFPVLFAASQLPRGGVAVVTTCAVIGTAVVVFTQRSFADGLPDFGFVAAALLVTATLLTEAEEQREALLQKMRRQAAIDPLTGLVTRRVLDEAARTALSGAASPEGTVLILIDVDHFKWINDSFGHPGGDDVLRGVAEVLTSLSRPNDVVSRLGGDEIALLLPGCPPAAGLERARQIIEAIRSRRFRTAAGEFVDVTVSIGLAHAPTHAGDLRPLYSAADIALYQAKRAGRNRIGEPAATGL
ncbi:GGDEF domain-containing protein [Nakamurella sp. YIM 132084]|uniref:GGDEF domain-containing protein n=1 Tax=Nakamurella leprariae TaxID=2803911 RepID=A0A938YG74_9ACTN|nr:GGDEF domain-containing protein [Nakamurella leprariae]